MSNLSVANPTDRVKRRATSSPTLPPGFQPVATVTFRTPAFIPESCLAAYDPTPVDDLRLDARATDLGRPAPAPGERLTCGEVYDWMYDHGLQVAKQNACRSSYRHGRWAGRYTLVLDRAQTKSAAPIAVPESKRRTERKPAPQPTQEALMPIKGLTDNVKPRFPMIGKLRKGGPKELSKNGKESYGRDLNHWRFTSGLPEIVKAFETAFGPEPTVVPAYLPYVSVEENFATWKEAWNAGGLVHRCDGETCVVWRNGNKYSTEPKPCEFAGKPPTRDSCKNVGRLMVIIPQLIQAGYVGYVTVETHAINDLINMQAALEAAALKQTERGDPRGLQSILFMLRRMPTDVGVPGYGDNAGGRARQVKNLISIEPVPGFFEAQLALAAAPATKQVPLRSGFVNTETGEIIEPPDEDDDDEITESVIVMGPPTITASVPATAPAPAPTPAPATRPEKFDASELSELAASDAAFDAAFGDLVSARAERAAATAPSPAQQAAQPPLISAGSSSPAPAPHPVRPRPYDRDSMFYAIAAYTAWATANPDQVKINGTFGASLSILDKIGKGIGAHHRVLEALWQVRSATELSDAQKYALIKWVDPAKDRETKEWIPQQYLRVEVEALLGLTINSTGGI